MPEPIKTDQRYIPGLDGLRAIAVIAVIAYHLGVSWLPGGLLGVSVFFTLSGYLITDLLIAQVSAGGIRLRAFWVARARRLLPALAVMLTVVIAWVTVIGPHQPGDFRAAVLSASFYVNNWWLIFHHVSYFQSFGAATPLKHLWSLSVEEQFYILWPFVLAFGVHNIPAVSRRTGARPLLATAAFEGAVLSAVLMALLYHPASDPSRVYYGTDTRMMGLLVGATLALLMPSRRIRAQIPRRAARTIDRFGWAGLAVIALLFLTGDAYSPFLYRGGFVLLAVATGAVIVALVHPVASLGQLVGCRALRWIGVRSYGIYLWHYPIIVLSTPQGPPGFDPVRAVLQVAATVAVAAASWRFVEDPIRRGALDPLLQRLRAGLLARPRTGTAWARSIAVLVVVLAAVAGMAGVGTKDGSATEPGKLTLAANIVSNRTTVKGGITPGVDPNHTLCNSVLHIGDSTSEGLVSDDYLPDHGDQISAWYRRIGVIRQHLEISGARSIYERFKGQPNAHDVAVKWKKGHKYAGCWVLALGTNEAANVGAGSAFTFDQRIDSMMKVAGRKPVLWVNVKSLVRDGPYSEANMAAWDQALEAACARYPNMRVYDWASEVHDDWFINDGIHFTSEGYVNRGRRIAGALLSSFSVGSTIARPAGTSCVVGARQVKDPRVRRKTPPRRRAAGSSQLTASRVPVS